MATASSASLHPLSCLGAARWLGTVTPVAGVLLSAEFAVLAVASTSL